MIPYSRSSSGRWIMLKETFMMVLWALESLTRWRFDEIAEYDPCHPQQKMFSFPKFCETNFGTPNWSLNRIPVPMKGGRETWAFKGYSYSWRFVTKRILFQWLLYCYPQNIVFLCFPVEIAVNSLPFTQLSKNQVFTYAAHVVEIPPTKRDHEIDHV